MGLRELALGLGSVPVAREWRRFLTSRTFTPDNDMDVIIHAIGAGGSGGVANTGGYGVGQATGAGAGGYVKKRVTLKAGVAYTFTIGAGGAARLGNTSYPTAFSGNDGGDTSVTGGGINMVAGGGKAGLARSTGQPPANTLALAGGLGGTATGGDVNRSGGRGGNIAAGTTTPNSSGYLCQGTGGGGVNLLGDAECRGGDIGAKAFTSADSNSTGGGGIGENGFNNNQSGWSMGGGLGSLSGDGDGVATTLLARAFMGFWNVLGPRPTGSSNAGPGCGSTGGYSGYTPGAFAGSGGYGQYNGYGTTGDATYGGGTGGSSCGSTSTAGKSGKGGDGAIFLEILS